MKKLSAPEGIRGTRACIMLTQANGWELHFHDGPIPDQIPAEPIKHSSARTDGVSSSSLSASRDDARNGKPPASYCCAVSSRPRLILAKRRSTFENKGLRMEGSMIGRRRGQGTYFV
jgi:hypothetical protein